MWWRRRRSSLGHAERLRDRAAVCIPELGSALGLGDTTGDHRPRVPSAAPSITSCVKSATRLMLGCETRLANRAQRRALRVLYRACALCDVPFDHYQVHHVTWFRLGGLIDLRTCCRCAHGTTTSSTTAGWVLHLVADRTLTVTRTGGIVSTHGPPFLRAA